MSTAECFLFAGAFSKQEAPGVQSFRYDISNKLLTRIGVYGKYNSMSCMVTDKDLLVACVESKEDDLLVSFRILPDGSLEELCATHVEGCSLAHLLIDRERRYIFASSMASSMILLIRYDGDGSLTVLDTVKFTDPGSCEIGYSTNPRQGGSRIHSAFVTPDGTHVHVCNLGSDKIYTLALDSQNHKLTLLPELTVTLDGGEGPRHIVYSRDGTVAYVNAEMGNRIYAFSIGADCSLKFLQRVSTLDPTKENPPKGETSVSILSRNGKFLFCGNRGQNNFVKFDVGEDGLLTPAGYYDCHGVMPRGLTFGYDEQTIICSNNTSGTLAVIDYAAQSGTPGECLQIIEGVPGAANTVWTSYEPA